MADFDNVDSEAWMFRTSKGQLSLVIDINFSLRPSPIPENTDFDKWANTQTDRDLWTTKWSYKDLFFLRYGTLKIS